MSWSDKLKNLTGDTARLGAVKLSRSVPSDGQLGKLLRKLVPDAEPAEPAPPVQRFEPRRETSNPARAEPTAGAAPAAAPQPAWAGAGAAVALAVHPRPQERHHGPLSLAEFAPGDTVADVYAIEKILHRGPRFVLYRARHLCWNVAVALKAPTERALGDAELVAALPAAAARWTSVGLHPHVVYCHYVHHVDGVPMLVLEHVEGGDLRSWIKSGKAANLRLGLNLAVQLCHGVERLHEAEVRHGALTPSNILVSHAGILKVGNVSVAALGGPAATPAGASRRGEKLADDFRAPEDWIEAPVYDRRSDVFALGVCLYEMLCRHRPYDVTRGPRREPAEPRFNDGGEAVPPRLAEILKRCVDWEADRRPPSAAAVREQLCAVHREMFGYAGPFAELPPLSPAGDGLNNQGLAAELLGDVEAADLAWEDALRAAPGHAATTYNLGVSRWRRGLMTDQELVRHLGRLAGPQAGEAKLYLGLVHLERGDTDSARPLLERSETAEPAGDAVDEAWRSALRREDDERGKGRDLLGHRGFVSGVRLSQDGRWILSGGDDGTLRLWDSTTGQCARTFQAHEQRVSTVALDPSGSLALSGGEDAQLKLWDLKNGRCLHTVDVGGPVFCASLGAGGARAAVASSGSDSFLGIDSTVLQVFDLEKQRRLAGLVGHTSATKAIHLSADGQLVVTGSDDQTVRVWDAVGGSCRRVLEGHEHYVACVLLMPDGEHVLSGSWDQTMRLWQIKSGRCVRVFGKTGAIVTSLALTPDGRLAACGCWDGTVRLWEVASGRCIRTFEDHSRMVTGVALDAEGRVVASGSWDATVRWQPLPAANERYCSPRLCVAPAYGSMPPPEPGADELLAAARRALGEDRPAVALERLRRARAKAGEQPLEGAAELWRSLSNLCTRTGFHAARPAQRWKAKERIDAVRACPDADILLVAGESGLQLHEIELDRRLRTFEGHEARVLALAASADGRLALSAGADGTLRLWETTSGACRRVLRGHTSLVAALDATRDLRQGLSGSYDHTVRLWDLESGECARLLRGHRRQVTAVSLDAGARRAASGDFAGAVRVWDLGEGSSRPCDGHGARITGLALLTDRLVSTSADGSLRLWDAAAGECLQRLDGHGGSIRSLDVAPDERWALTCADDGTVRLWDLSDGTARELLAGEPDSITSACFGPDACWIAVVGRGTVRFLELEWELEAP